VPPGHVLIDRQDGERIVRYWNPLPSSRQIDWIPNDEADARFAALFAQAVERSLAIEPAGILLSGGLDSSAVAMVATDLCRRAGAAPPWAFSLTTPAPVDDEAAGQGIAEDLNIPRVLVSHGDAVGTLGMTAAAMDLTRVLPAPMFNISAPVYLKLCLLAARHGRRAILTGEGADEWLGMSPRLAANMLRAYDILGMVRLGKALDNYYAKVRWASVPGVIWQFGMRPALRKARDASAAIGRSIFKSRVHASAAARSRALSPLICEPWFAPSAAFRSQLATRLETHGATEGRPTGLDDAYRRTVLANLDAPSSGLRAEEAFLLGRYSGVHQQDPFWDADLIELAVRIRPNVRNRGGVSKALLRDALAKRFPQRAFDAQRKSPSRALLLQSLYLEGARGALRTLGKHWVLGELGVVDVRQAIEFVHHPPDGKGWRAWDLINLETWVRAHA
jgi:asparagine synthase (glutamine-hydrolysing)